MHQSAAYAIYWIPSGYSVSPSYESLIDGFFQNVAAASGVSDNVYSVAAQYSDTMGSGSYDSTFGGSVVDTDPFPTNGCTDGGLPICLTDAQVQAEVDKVIAAHGWQAGLSREFFLFTPLSVGSCFDSSSSTCAYSYYCAYHSSFASSLGNGTVLYANLPYAAEPAAGGACDRGERPNGDDADATMNLISHEHAESITDPLLNAWSDDAGYEIGDKCAWIFGSLLGSTGGSGTNTDYNQQIGTGKYYLQEEWSNQTVDATSGEPGSCVQRDMPQLVPTGPGNGSVSSTGGLVCSTTPCDLSAEVGTTVTLTAHPASGSTFVGWRGACSGAGTCTLTVTPTTSVSARFETSTLPAGWAVEPLAPPAGVDPLLLQGTHPEVNFSRVAEAASGNERATTIYNGDGGCPIWSAAQSGGIYLQRETNTGWVADGTLTAPAVGTDEWRYWASCSEFGAEVSLSADGSTLLASQIMDQVGPNDFRCAAFIYERGPTGWTQAATLFPPGIGPSGSPAPSGCGYFGISSTLSADGKRAVLLSADSVDVFTQGASGWSLEQHLALPAGDNCYYTIAPPRIAISGDGSRLLVGAPDCTVSGEPNAGRVYDYERSGSTWALAQTIDTPEPILDNYFGTVVSLSSDGDTAVIETQDSPGLPLFAGAAWVYEHDGSGWQQRIRLTTPAPQTYDLLACPYLSGDGSQIICVAYDTVGFDPAQGSIYAFQRPGTSWTSAPAPLRFFAGDGHTDDNLGAGHSAIYWFNPASVAVPAAGGDITTTIAAQNVGLYSDDRIGYEFTTAPVIRSFSPSHALAGAHITIKGANFTNATTVRFAGVAATNFTVDSPTQITATVPPAATAGTIGVTTSKGSGWSTTSFSPLPAISSISPGSGVAGTRVTIVGTNLAGASAVKFNGVAAANFDVSSPTQIAAVVPATATTGAVTVATPSGTASSSTVFKPLPAISAFSPLRGIAGTTVTITGANLADASAVTFNGVAAASFSVASPTQIRAVVPATSRRGELTVVTPAGTATSSSVFIPAPLIDSISPGRGRAGAKVRIEGTNLSGALGVQFARRKAHFILRSPTLIVCRVPKKAGVGHIAVTTSDGRTVSSETFKPLPVIVSIRPRTAAVGAKLTILGTNLGGATRITFNGLRARFDVVSPTRILTTVPRGTTTGQIIVTTRAGKASSRFAFQPRHR